MEFTDLQQVQFYDKYSRWNPTTGRRETWPETVRRVMDFMRQTVTDHVFTNRLPPWSVQKIDFAGLEQAMLRMEVLPSMRVVQMAGPALDRCNVGAYNCSYLPLKDWFAFSELLYILMQGTGVGFSVEREYVDQLPEIAHQQANVLPILHTIEDDTEGWCNAFYLGLTTWAGGKEVLFNYDRIRPYGTPLKTKGGRASGPEPLHQLLDFARKLLLSHQGRKLSSLNVHDLACYCGSIVQVGGVRRAAEISLSDRDDVKLRRAKSGRFYDLYPERMMANNSAVYATKPPMEDFIHEWSELMTSGTGERGIFNRGDVNAIQRRQGLSRLPRKDWGLNPCGEIILRPFEFCNLSIAVARPEDHVMELERKVQLAAQFGMIQSLLTNFNYIRPEWAANCEEERLLGVDITGQMDHPFFNGPASEWTYKQLRAAVREEVYTLSQALGINLPAATTCVKPSGNSSQLLNVSSGLHPRYAPYYIRRLRIGSGSPVALLLRAAGVPHHPETGQSPTNPSVWVFDFPVKAPANAITRHEMTALAQLEQWKKCKVNYTEHNPSVTVYIRDNEWLDVGAWVYRNWDCIGGVSFLPFDGGLYELAPYEEISAAEYDRRIAEWPKIDFAQLSRYETTDSTELNREFACTGDKCEL